MKNYLSIGEVSKIKGVVSTKSLRYYDEIGIFSPSYIDPETGYRYYTMDQMVELELIIIAVRLGIPLKSLHNFKDENNNLHINEMITEGKKITEEKIRKLKYVNYKLDNIAKHITTSKAIMNKKGDYTRYIPERHIIYTPWTPDKELLRTYIEKTSILFYQAKEVLKKATLFQQGFLYQFTEQGIMKNVYMEIEPSENPHPDVLVLPEAEYRCRFYPHARISEIRPQYLETANFPNGTIVLGAEMIGESVDNTLSSYELQILDTLKNVTL